MKNISITEEKLLLLAALSFEADELKHTVPSAAL